VQYQAVIQMAQMAPDIYDLPFLHRQMLSVLGIKNAEKLVPLPDDQKPRDPVSENMMVLKGEPVKAFFYQDHQAHIQVHMSAMNDPLIQQLIGQNPRAPQIQAAMMAHIAEHVGFAYRQKIEQQMGVSLPPEDEKLPPQVELALSSMMAQAAQQVLQENQAQVAQQQAQQQMQDPMVQMQMQELQLKEREVGIKEQKAQADAMLAAQRLELDKEKTQADIQLGGLKAASQIEMDKQKLAATQQAEGVRLGMEGQKAKEQSDFQRKQAALKHMATFKKTDKPPKGE
jgi:hypothetical protein